MKNYHRDIASKFRAPAPRHPVIVLVDNDSGANAIYGAIAGITGKKKPTGTEQFIHVVGNLYVVATPLGPAGAKTMIENFFDEKTLATTLNGKTFSTSKEIDEAKEYGKTAFARDVVEKNAGTIGFFNGFAPILDRVAVVVAEYAKSHMSGVTVP